jgi:protease I
VFRHLGIYPARYKQAGWEEIMKKIFVLAILFCLFCGGKGEEQAKPVTPEKEIPQISKSVLMIIAPKDFRDEEFKEPYDLFTKSGIKVTIASTDTSPAKGMLGMVVKPEIKLQRVNPDNFDAVVIVGGSGCQDLWNNTKLHEIVNAFNNSKKTIAAICIAPVVLARAGILEEKEATVYPSVKDELTKYGANYSENDVEICDNIITGSGPKVAADFAQAILNTLSQ